MAPRRRATVARTLCVALAAWLTAAIPVFAQESGAQPWSARSLWSRILGASEYEYDERLDLSLDGSAVVDINASVAALVALHGAKLDIDPEARFDRQAVRDLFTTPGSAIRELSAFRRHGRRFVHVRLDVPDIRTLPAAGPLSWSRYQLERTDRDVHFIQDVGTPRGSPVGNVGWTGSELVAFRLQLPSRIDFHNAPDGVERGNILAWEQPLRDRLAGRPLHMEARMDPQSILYRTLWLFGGTFVSAMAVLALIVSWIKRKGTKRAVGSRL